MFDTITVEPENVIVYDYDEVWKDKLKSFGNTAITYDNIGNPLTIGNKSFTWSGRQLETYTQGNKTIEFEYDENGLRHRKTVKENGVIIERYDYVWSDGSLITQTYTTYSNGVLDSTNSAKFIYDAWGTLQGFVLNDTATYLYTKNLQGDILSIVNESGQTIVTYEYDSWGAVSFSATSMQNMMLAYTLSFVSPFTYRGYCYDYDIELYYLQSRYYSAEIGRFINTDDTKIAIATVGTVLGANLFAYCDNNPVNLIDVNGYGPWTKPLKIWDYNQIHREVQKRVVSNISKGIFRMEVYVKGPKGNGRLDVYDVSRNEYYEIKSIGSAYTTSTINQMIKYDNAKVPGKEKNVKRGNFSFSGYFYYGAWEVHYYSSSVKGLIVYEVIWNRARYKKALAIGLSTVAVVAFVGFTIYATGGAAIPIFAKAGYVLCFV